ncbi:MAG: hypothetical protein LH473_05105 [Chitinophagales bacterium]|nr:hypothetical protein [Chitinophagales bacterium]
MSIEGKGYIGLGHYTNEQTQDNIDYMDLWEYDTVNDTWTKKANFVNSRKLAVAFSIGHKGYVGAGYSIGAPNLNNDFWQYDPSSNFWTQKADIPDSPRMEAVGFSIAGKGYVGT